MGRASGHFVEDQAESEEIGACVEFFAAGLLGRHISDRADGDAGAGEFRRSRRTFVAWRAQRIA